MHSHPCARSSANRRWKVVALFALCLIALASCDPGDPPTPETVALEFFRAMDAREPDWARALVTDPADLDGMQGGLGGSGQAEAIELSDTRQDGTQAVVMVRITLACRKPFETRTYLVEQDGRWKVDFESTLFAYFDAWGGAEPVNEVCPPIADRPLAGRIHGEAFTGDKLFGANERHVIYGPEVQSKRDTDGAPSILLNLDFTKSRGVLGLDGNVTLARGGHNLVVLEGSYLIEPRDRRVRLWLRSGDPGDPDNFVDGWVEAASLDQDPNQIPCWRSPPTSGFMAPEALTLETSGADQKTSPIAPVPLEPPLSHAGFGGFSFTRDGRYLVGGTRIGEVVLWDTERGCLIRTLGRHGANVGWVGVTRDGEQLLSFSSQNGLAKVWSMASGALERDIQLASGSQVALAPGGDRLFELLAEPGASTSGTRGRGRGVRAWSWRTGERQWETPIQGAQLLGPSPDGTRVAVAATEEIQQDGPNGPRTRTQHHLMLLDGVSGIPLWNVDPADTPEGLQVLSDGRSLASLEGRSLLRRLSIADGRELNRVVLPRALGPPRLQIDAGPGRLAARWEETKPAMLVWDLAVNRPRFTLRAAKWSVCSNVWWAPDLRSLVCDGMYGPALYSLAFLIGEQ